MRTTPQEPTESGLTLGAPVRQPKPAPGPTKTDTAGVYRGADGKAFTDIPAPTPVWHPVAPVVHVDDADLCEMPVIVSPWFYDMALQRWCDEEMAKVLPKAGQ